MCASQMRLVDKIRARLVQEQVKLTDRLAQIIGFTKSTDTESIIDKEKIPDKAKEWLIEQKETLIESFPRENTAKLRATEDMSNIDQYAVLVMFKQLLRAQNSRLVSRKIYNWSTKSYELDKVIDENIYGVLGTRLNICNNKYHNNKLEFKHLKFIDTIM